MEGKEDFDFAMALAMRGRHKTVGYRIHENTLILYWTQSKKAVPLPYAMNESDTIAFAWGWLQTVEPSMKEPNHDGDNKKGFHIFTDDIWDHVFDEWEAYIAIEPIWAMYGK